MLPSFEGKVGRGITWACSLELMPLLQLQLKWYALLFSVYLDMAAKQGQRRHTDPRWYLECFTYLNLEVLSALPCTTWTGVVPLRPLPAASSHNISLIQCILVVALSFLATGNLQHVVASVHNVSQQSASHCLCRFLDTMLQHLDHYLPFPTAEGELHRVHEVQTRCICPARASQPAPAI